ncbi:hypothetical protein LTR56_000945 [Elasticomyces elasticus]|nr:hypothetical protein LTR56_000945 [Elasticomyces elasticus]KAK3665519.1 hypothetical protein LTR22_003749 [Elasticomyces elasticus]KAK4929838.1 hypothetical protein LTR49_003465 [Elasticomyces elasticus]KAK5759461.1 hypothetical protein LTS12_010474 [Elasticomyces elasticus]
MAALEVEGDRSTTRKGGLLGLPKELSSHILTFITRPRDMINVCRVSKQIQVIASPLLYRDVHLDLLSSKPAKVIIALLNSTNPGLKMIRNLIVNEK